MTNSARARGKSFERRCAEVYGGMRIGLLGKDDVLTDHLTIECKSVSEDGIRGAWIEQARKHSDVRGKPWLLVKRKKGSHSPVVVMDEGFALALLEECGFIERG